MSTTTFFKRSLTTIVMHLLDRDGAMYGYEITQRVKFLTNGKLLINEGALYPILHKLEARGYVTITAKIVDNRVRKYYQLTPYGTTEKAQQVNDLQLYVETMSQLLHLKPCK